MGDIFYFFLLFGMFQMFFNEPIWLVKWRKSKHAENEEGEEAEVEKGRASQSWHRCGSTGVRAAPP